VIPVNQHFGAPIQPLVKVGEFVRAGQKIADAEGRMTVPIHASIAGVVKRIEPRMVSSNSEGMCIIIEPKDPPEGQSVQEFMDPLDPFACSKEHALERIREAGIIGMGGAGFPAHVKLAPSKSISLVIANAAECEPYLTIDERTAPRNATESRRWPLYCNEDRQCERGYSRDRREQAACCSHSTKSDRRKCARQSRAKNPHSAFAHKISPRRGKMLITAITGKKVPSGGLPMDVGCVVSNVGTLCAIADAFRNGKPVIERGFTVTGGACKTPKNLVAPVGRARFRSCKGWDH